eukprot:TRINITY_DN61547_c0_g1_i1.p2 TRINITY_DN61547_c0_g1~~TRINITY_DN61547_c0_g1_i1.p2  ORF type:complete len:106 (-),score=8.17 TRINITY_DN61547_c0_g1_i1:11-328(-)
MPAVVPFDTKHILKLVHLLDHLIQPLVRIDQKPYLAGTATIDRHAGNTFNMIGPTGKQAAYMRHHTGMISHCQFKNSLLTHVFHLQSFQNSRLREEPWDKQVHPG